MVWAELGNDKEGWCILSYLHRCCVEHISQSCLFTRNVNTIPATFRGVNTRELDKQKGLRFGVHLGLKGFHFRFSEERGAKQEGGIMCNLDLALKHNMFVCDNDV